MIGRDEYDTVNVSTALGKDKDGKLIPLVFVQWDDGQLVVSPGDARELGLNLLEAAIRTEVDVALVDVVRKDGGSREDSQAFLYALRKAMSSK